MTSPRRHNVLLAVLLAVGAPVSSIYSLDTFTGASAVTSGSAPNPATTNVTEILYVSFVMPPTAGDLFDWVVTFPTGDMVLRLNFTSATQLLLQYIDSIGGGPTTTTIATYNDPTGNFPLDGATGHLHFRVTRNTGPVTTTFTLGWRGTRTPSSASTSTSFTLSGLLTPTSAAFAITGGAPVVGGADIEGRVPDGGGNAVIGTGAWEWRPARSTIGGTASPPRTEGSSDGYFTIVDGVLRHQFPDNANDFEFDNYALPGIPNLGADYSVEVTGQFHDINGTFFGPMARMDTDGFGYRLIALANPFPNPGIGIYGYQFRLQRINSDTGGDPEEGVFTLLANVIVDDADPPPYDTDITLRLCVSTSDDGVLLQGYLNGELLIEEEDTDADLFATGDPGLVMRDDTIFSYVEYGLIVSRVTVAAQDDGNPGGGGGAPGTDAFLWGMQKGGWRAAPTPSEITDAVQAHAKGAPRVVIAGWTEANGAWRPLPVSEPDTTGDPGDGVPDIGCIDVTTLVPPGPVDPLGTRLFYEAMLPDGLYGDGTLTPFNATTEPMGDFILNRLAAAASTGMIILGTQGGYTKFRTGGNYDPDLMDDFIDAHGAISAALEAYFIAGQFYGVSIADDFESSSLWPPSGLSVTELKRIASRWKSVLSWGLRVSIRGRPTQFAGENLSGYIDNCRAQFHYRQSKTPSDWLDDELAACASIGVPSILYSLNWTKGGSTGGAMTPTQITDAAAVFTDPATEATGIDNHGGGGWRYDTATYPAQLASYVTYRNWLAAL